MDLVDEEHFTRPEIGQNGSEITDFLNRRARRYFQGCTHLARDQMGESGLAEARWAVEEEMLGRLLALPSRRE